MKTIRYLAACLMLFSGIAHLILAIKDPSDQYFVLSIAFGIIYLAIGTFLILKKKFAIWMGLLIPIIPLVLSTFMVDLKTLDTWSIVILAIDLVVVICCLILLLNKNKS
jgi:uncharacterized membrane protein HdeD (DUF308 family)